MARPIVLANGEMHVGINNYGLVHDLYYPYVGLENHTIGKGLRHRVGVWIDGQIHWLDDGNWDTRFSYPHTALIGHTRAHNDTLQLSIEFDDAVDSDTNAFMRNIHVINHAEHDREVRLFMHQAFVIGDSRGNTDTAQYLPDSNAIVHYRGRRAFVISGESDGQPFDQHSIGLFGIEGHEGTWRDADDGELSNSTIEHGRVDSCLRFCLQLPAHSSKRVQYWIAAGTSLREALTVSRQIQEDSVHTRLNSTALSWQNWLEPVLAMTAEMTHARARMCIESAMIIRSHLDKRGAVIASTDSAMLNYNRDAYAYCWPRDGAYVLWPLMRLGYRHEARTFFDFCRRGLHTSGYLSHKYRADGALGSSWHPYVHEGGIIAPPIQTDETALTLFVFAQYYHLQPSDTELAEYYDSFVKPMASFLAGYIDAETQLPKPSYDLWEEQFMISTYTTAVTYAALLAAAELADAAHDEASAVTWRAVADDMYDAAQEHLFDSERQVIIKGLKPTADGYVRDTTIDMSCIFGAFMYGLFDTSSDQLQQSIATMRTRFSTDDVVGLPRYENDSYRRPDGELLSNYWHIATLWHAQYCIETGDDSQAQRILSWVENHSFETGVLSEQILPQSEFSTSVAPLAWSHAEYLAAILDANEPTGKPADGS